VTFEASTNGTSWTPLARVNVSRRLATHRHHGPGGAEIRARVLSPTAVSGGHPANNPARGPGDHHSDGTFGVISNKFCFTIAGVSGQRSS